MSDDDTEYTYEHVQRQPALPLDYYKGLCRKLEARITELEGQLARTWQPVPDSYIEGDMSMWGLMVYGNMLVIGNGNGGHVFLMPSGKRLCHLADAQPAMSAEVAVTLQNSLEFSKRTITELGPLYHYSTREDGKDDVIAAIDAALSWLAAQPRPQKEGD